MWDSTKNPVFKKSLINIFVKDKSGMLKIGYCWNLQLNLSK